MAPTSSAHRGDRRRMKVCVWCVRECECVVVNVVGRARSLSTRLGNSGNQRAGLRVCYLRVSCGRGVGHAHGMYGGEPCHRELELI